MRPGISVRRALCLLVMACLSFSLTAVAASAASYPAKWSKSPAPVRCYTGRSATIKVTLKASRKIGKITLKLSSGLPGTKKLSPTTISSLKKGASKTVSIKITLPAGATPGTYSAKLTAKSRGKNIAAPLTVRLTASKPRVKFVSSTPHEVAEQAVGASGAVITAPGGSPIGGAQVGIPAGAVSPGTNVELSYETGSMQPADGSYAGYALEINGTAPTGQRNPDHMTFEQPVTITLPIAQPGKIPVPYNILPDGTLELAHLTRIDGSTFSFQTFHESRYTVVYASPKGAGAAASFAAEGSSVAATTTTSTLSSVSTNFFPSLDGFQIVNTGSGFAPGGECFGMVSFGLWYYQNAMASKGWFYPRFMNKDYGFGVKGQNIIATRAHMSIHRYFASYYYNAGVVSQWNLTPQARYTAIVDAMKNTGNPVLVQLWPSDNSGGGHSVLGTQVNGTTGDLTIYDPNHPGSSRTIDWDDTQKKLLPYGGYGYVSFCGDGSMHVKEDFSAILADAEDDFHGSYATQIVVQSHKPYKKASAGPPPTPEEGVVTDRTITISGRFHSGSVKVEKITIYVGDTPYTANVTADSGGSGSFSIPVSLKAGMNKLNFKSEGYNARNQRIGLPTMAYYDKDGDGLPDPHRSHESHSAERVMKYQIKLNAGLAVMLATLTWNTATDVDLYVTDPTGATSWYGGHTTPSGGTLDHDVTSGFGPEHFTLLDSNTIQWGQPYTVRVHYYSDRADAEHPVPTSYQVTIDLYEGTPHATSRTYTGTLVGDSSSNSSPGSSGTGWDTVATITLEEPPEAP